jgi:DNA modification methylase
MMKPAYETTLGKAFCGDSIEVMREMEPDSVDLVVTSPPYALHFKKEYGNVDQRNYIDWFTPFATEIRRVLRHRGSFVLNIGGAWTPGKPTRSLYHIRLLLHLCDGIGFHLCQEFFWYNPAKLPAPAEWVNVRRLRVKDSVEYIYWLGKTPNPKADNSKVLQPYSKDMLRLIRRGVTRTVRPSGPNYLATLKRRKRKIHPARFPAELPRFFINFLTERGDLVLDPFAGSNTTGSVAEGLGRRWISVEISPEYVEDSRVRFLVAVDQVSQPNSRRAPVQLELAPTSGDEANADSMARDRPRKSKRKRK